MGVLGNLGDSKNCRSFDLKLEALRVEGLKFEVGVEVGTRTRGLRLRVGAPNAHVMITSARDLIGTRLRPSHPNPKSRPSVLSSPSPRLLGYPRDEFTISSESPQAVYEFGSL
jgi:hypothetical protein